MSSSILTAVENFFYMLVMAGISTFTVCQYFQMFFEKKKKTIVVWGIWGLFFLWQMVSMLGIPAFPAWLRLLISIGSVIVVSCNVGGSFFQKIVFSIIYNAIWMLSELMIGCFFIVLNIDYNSQNLVGSMISKMFLLVLVKMLQQFFFHDTLRKLSFRYNVVLMLIPIGSMLIAAHLFIMSSKIEAIIYIYASIVAFLIIIIVNIVIFKIYMGLSDNLELKRKNSMYQLELSLYNEHMKEKESAMDEFRQARHDLKHQIIYLLELSEKKEYEKLDSHLKKLIDWELLDGVSIVNTDNLTIDSLINYKYSIAKRYGITFRVKLEIPTSLPFEDVDLCILLGNAIDNAMEACLRENVPTPYVDLKIKYDRKNLIGIVENSFDGKICRNNQGKIVTRKEKKYKHGMGIDSIQRVVDKYHGYLDIESKNYIFRLKFILYSD